MGGVGCMTSILATAFAICLSYADTDAAVMSCARTEAATIARRLELTRPLNIRIVPVTPLRNALASQWAWARRSKIGSGCDLDFLPDAIRDLETIAHEVCHCRHHYRYMTVSGKVEIGGAELSRVEREAESCAREMTR